ncbi:DNA primase [Acidithiobacillus caldus SM-1]|uniref:DNA primase n=1 Tax=Acidithiobacillus caldus (strain SM-1) TaxID=990288 RepID=F9ZNU8_ACICS|nr:zincin-like metallopeptidase domain-containing protein [Acidithiobacillus caldus]AEK57928.1 DNA primase [Acidithiobacillus caldus SM-1]
MANRDLRLEVANELIKRIEEGTAPWQKPSNAGEVTLPVNAVTGNPYTGVNRQNLMMFSPDPTDPRWCTYNQAKKQGWQVREGSKGVPIEVWKEYEHKRTNEEIENIRTGRAEGGLNPDEPIAETEKRLSVRYYTVFHASQIDGIPPLERPAPQQQIEGEPDPRIEELAKAMGVSVGRGGDRAFYSSAQDHIQMPNVADFKSAVGHDTTFLHELSHATGHESRLHRELGNGFGSEKYAIEELRAEMAAAMTAASLGIGFDPQSQDMEEGREVGNTAAYLASWLGALPEKERKQIMVQTIKDAQGISDYLIERTPELKVEMEAPTLDSAMLQVYEQMGQMRRVVDDPDFDKAMESLSSVMEQKGISDAVKVDVLTTALDEMEASESLFDGDKDIRDAINFGHEAIRVYNSKTKDLENAQNLPQGVDAVHLVLTHRQDLQSQREEYMDDAKREVTLHVPVQKVEGKLRNFSQSAYEIDTKEYGPVWVETGFRLASDDKDPLIQFASEAMKNGTEVIVSVSNDGLVTTIEDANVRGKAFSTVHDVPARPIALMDSVAYLNSPNEKGTKIQGTLVEVYDVNQVEVLTKDGAHVYVSAGGPANRDLEPMKALRGKEVVVAADEHRMLTVQTAQERDRTITLDPDLVGLLKDYQQIRQGNRGLSTEMPARGDDWPGGLPTGLGGDRLANAEEFVRRFAARNPEVAEKWATMLSESPKAYGDVSDTPRDRVAYLAKRMEEAVERVRHPQVGDVIRFEPNEEQGRTGKEPFTGRVVATLDTSGGDIRYHLRAESGIQMGAESVVYGKDGRFREADPEKAVGSDRNLPPEMSLKEAVQALRGESMTLPNGKSVDAHDYLESGLKRGYTIDVDNGSAYWNKEGKRGLEIADPKILDAVKVSLAQGGDITKNLSRVLTENQVSRGLGASKATPARAGSEIE